MRRETAAISPVTEVVQAIRAGEIVILVDDEDRENEGDLVFAADFVTPEKINFLAKHGRGLICMPITEEHAARLGLRADGRAEPLPAWHELHRVDRGRRRHRHRHLGARSRTHHQSGLRARREGRRHRPAGACLSARGAPRRRARPRRPPRRRAAIWRASPGSRPPRCCARSCATTARWRGSPTSSSSPSRTN